MDTFYLLNAAGMITVVMVPSRKFLARDYIFMFFSTKSLVSQ
jgi:hypothetical protein